MEYRRLYVQGVCYFFTVVTYQRRPILTNPDIWQTLKTAFKNEQQKNPFEIEALVILPDHLHTIWKLPENDADYSKRWNNIKRYVSFHCGENYALPRSKTQISKRQSTIWQPRFWEHCIRDDDDFYKHLDYIHYNPVKHGYVKNVADWRHSTFHRYVKEKIYPIDWGGVSDDFVLPYE